MVRCRICALVFVSAAALFWQENANAPRRGGNSLIQPLADLQKRPKSKLEYIAAHAKSLEGNSPDRDVFVYLPPYYGNEPNRQYPVVYTPHGDGSHAQQRVGFANVSGLEKGLTAGAVKEMTSALGFEFHAFTCEQTKSCPELPTFDSGCTFNLVVGEQFHFVWPDWRDKRSIIAYIPAWWPKPTGTFT